jgi:hypothetical protein
MKRESKDTFRESEKDTREGLEGFKEGHRKFVREIRSRAYLVSHRGEYFIALNPSYEHDNIYVYRQVEAIPIARLKEEFKNVEDRGLLLHFFFIKKEFGSEPHLIYDLQL